MLSKRALGLVVGLVVSAARLGAQAWDDPRVLALVRRATDRRVQQLADSGLAGYQATAHGYLTFLAQLGEGFRELPRVVKADELAIEVYWRAPNLSKQHIIGRRDTTLLPTDIEYHRDHLGIIQNNFPAIIRVGEGDEVADVPHPLSENGFGSYQFALTDSLRITMPGRVIDVYEVQVRPRNDRVPGVVGAVYLDRDDGRVVRMAFNFTRASLLDKQLEDVSIVLENGLVDGRFWLPRSQEVEIRRTLTWLDYPVRGIIRGRWDIRDYVINTDLPVIAFFAGPEITQAPQALLKTYAWTTPRLTDSLPEESRIPTPTEIRRVQDAARLLIREQGLKRARGMLAGKSASDFIRFDRTGGLALGSGVSLNDGHGLVAEVVGRYAFGRRRREGQVAFGWQSARGAGLKLYVSDDVRSAGDQQERSTLVNSLASQEFASDFTDHFGTRELGLVGLLPWGSTNWTLSIASASQFPLALSARSFAGTYAPAFDAARQSVRTIALDVDVPTSNLWKGFEWRMHGSSRASEEGNFAEQAQSCPPLPASCRTNSSVGRLALSVDVERALGGARLLHHTFVGGVTGSNFLSSQDLFFQGGPVSAPGYAYHSLVGDRVLSQGFEVRVPIPFPRVSLGRFGRSPSEAWLAPHWNGTAIHAVDPGTELQRGSGAPTGADPFRATATGWYQSAGVSLITAFDLLRLDASRSIPTGRWLFTVDMTRPFWSIM